MEASRTLKEGINQDTRALGKNTKKHFDVWDLNKDGEIDIDEVKIRQQDVTNNCKEV